MQREVDDMEAQLMALARAVPFPETPDLAAGFWRRLEESDRGRAVAPASSLAGVALAAAIVVAAVVIGTLAPARDAAADLFDRINIFEADEDAFETISYSITGQEVTFNEAEHRLGQPIALPTSPEGIESALTRVVYREFGSADQPRGVAYLFFEPAKDTPFILVATNAGVGKGLAPGATAEPVDELSGEAYWVEGRHFVELEGGFGGVISEARRATDANTLVWFDGNSVYRIEGELSRSEAILIALSME